MYKGVGDTVRTEATSPGMFDTFPNVCELGGWFASVTPDYLAGLFEALLMICEGDEVFKGGHRTPWSEPDVRRDSRYGFSCLIIRGRLLCESVVVLNTHGMVGGHVKR